MAAFAATASAGSSTTPLSIKFTNNAASGHAFAISAYEEPNGPCWVLGDRSRRYAYAFQPGKAGGDAGFNRVALRTRIGGHLVQPGRWRVQVRAVNAMGVTSTQTRVLTVR